MKKTTITIRMASILALVFILAACSTPTVVTQPTQDIPAVRTEAVQTAMARLTIEAALNPTATAEPTQVVPTEAPQPTATAEPTATSAPTATEAPAATATSLPTAQPTAVTGGGSGVVYPTATRRTGPDQAQLVDQTPRDGTVFHPGADFDGVWTFKNIGTSTWTTDYDFRFVSGTNYASANSFPVPQEVKPGETVRLIVDMVAPPTAGRTVSNWEMVNENGDVFAKFYLVIDVQ